MEKPEYTFVHRNMSADIMRSNFDYTKYYRGRMVNLGVAWVNRDNISEVSSNDDLDVRTVTMDSGTVYYTFRTVEEILDTTFLDRK